MNIKDEHGHPVDINFLEKEEQDLAMQYVQPDDVVFELGARIRLCFLYCKLDLEQQKQSSCGGT